MRSTRGLPFLIVSALASLVPSIARADDPATAQALFDRGKQLMRERRFADACPKFEESQRVDPGMGTQFHLADCWQHIGRSASAWALFREVESEAHATSQVARERVAHDRAQALEPWLSKLTVVVHGADASPGLEIRRDGTVVGREQWGVPVPVDPGTHVVTVAAAEAKPWRTTIDVPADAKVMTLDIVAPHPADMKAAAQPAAPPAPPTPPAEVARKKPVIPAGVAAPMPEAPADLAVHPVLHEQDGGGVARSVGWVFVAAGGVGLAIGGYLGVRWLQDSSDAAAHCPGGVCDAAGQSLQNNAHDEGRLLEAAVGVGGAAAFVGGVLVAAAAGSHTVSTRTSSIGIAPMWLASGGGIGVHGVW